MCMSVCMHTHIEYLFICMQAHELGVSGSEDKGSLYVCVCVCAHKSTCVHVCVRAH